MKDLLLYVARNLVNEPDSVTVTEIPGEITFIRVDERREGEMYTDQYQRLIREAPEGLRAVMKLD